MLTYHAFTTEPTAEWLALLNDERVRHHLLEHPLFDEASLAKWLSNKIAADQQPGCRLRAIRAGASLAGWCGIQFESGSYELALVLSPNHWGRGRQVVHDVLTWALELGHSHLVAHLPTTRPQVRALARLFGNPIANTFIEAQRFSTYHVDVRSLTGPKR